MRIESNDVYVLSYQKLCECILEDENMNSLLQADKVVCDFDLIDDPSKEEFVNVPYQPSTRPRFYILPQSVQYPRESSCNNNLIIQYQFVLEGFQARDMLFHQICYRLLALLRDIPFVTIILDNQCFPVLCNVGDGTWEYDAEHQTMTHTVGLQVEIRI